MGSDKKLWLVVISMFILLSSKAELTVSKSESEFPTSTGRKLSSSRQLKYVSSRQEANIGNKLIDLKVGMGGFGAGIIKSLTYKRDGKPDLELLDLHTRNGPRGYWDMHWESGSYISGKEDNVKLKFGDTKGASWTSSGHGDEDDMVGVTFDAQDTRGRKHRQPVNTAVHYSVRKDVAGAYCTLLVDHTPTHPAIQLTELRLVLKLDPNLFDYSYVADDRQRFMPTRGDISNHHSSRLAFKEARLITKPQNMSLLHQVDHKYQFSLETKDSLLYGWISTKLGVGVWIISPNKVEYMGGGPNKQDLSVQTGPNLLAMLHSRHYGTPAIDIEGAEQWQKAYGPFLIYVNEGRDIAELIADAKLRAAEEAKSWPYKWVPFAEYTRREDRGTVTGRVVKRDPFAVEVSTVPGTWMGITNRNSPLSNWEDEVKGYQFWNTTNDDGEFTIYNVRPGSYILHSLVHGVLVDSNHTAELLQTVTVQGNWVSNVGEIVLRPAQTGRIVWEIGLPDRSASEFMIPAELGRSSENHTSSSKDHAFRQYGVWEKFAELYPDKDPVFTIGTSDWETDWFFAHVVRPNNTSTHRQIVFFLDRIVQGDYTLRLAIAGAHQAALEIRVNNPKGAPVHDTGPFGKDNALARAGIHGHYQLFSIALPHDNFRVGNNSVFLHQRKNQNKFSYVMYDYIRLEAPPTQPMMNS